MSSDICAEFEQLLMNMEWHEVVSTLLDVIEEKSANLTPQPSPSASTQPPSAPSPSPSASTQPPSPPSPSPSASTQPSSPPSRSPTLSPTETSEHSDPPQLVYTVLDTPMVEAPPFFVETLPVCSSEVLEEHIEVVAAPAEAAAEVNQQQEPTNNKEEECGEEQCNNVHRFVEPSQINQNLHPLARLKGELVYEIPPNDYGPCIYEAPPPFMYNPRGNQEPEEKDPNKPYIKKPLNAFMIFRKEERENVMAEFDITDSAVINSILGSKWRSMSRQEQTKYFTMAKKEKELHTEQFPNWSAVHNYGKKRRYDRSKAKPPPKGKKKKD